METFERNRQLGYFAVKVRSRAEATITDTLRRKGYEVLLPTYVRRQQYSDRMKQNSQPLFPGYVFVRLHAERLLGVVSTNGVSYVVKSGNAMRPLPAAEEQLLHSLSALAGVCEPCKFPEVGQRVHIKSGPLQDQHGTLVRIGNRERLVVSLQSIFSSVTVNLRDVAVQPCDT
jgi:transcriptional antiterminator RfaH